MFQKRETHLRHMTIVGLCWLACSGTGEAESPGTVAMGYPEMIEAAKHDPSLRKSIAALTAEADVEVERGLVRRAHRWEDIGKHRTWLDGRSNALEDEIRETFALAMSDFGTCNLLAQTLPSMATAARLSGDAKLRDHVIAQLREASGWRPLQRPGWTLFKPGNRLPKDGKDGNWLATGCGVRAIVTTLEIMGDQVPADVRNALSELLRNEIDGVIDDWRTRRPWFVRGNNAVTNQWVLPTEGLIRASLHLGRERYRDAYELGVRNLLQALNAHGQAGEFEEGIGYAGFTVTSMLHAAHAMAVSGDRRAIDHPFLVNFPTWAVHHIQPGRMTVNCFDAGNASLPRSQATWRSLLALSVSASGSEVANWALHEQFDGPMDDFSGFVYRVTGKMVGRREPGLFAAYQRAPMVVWRDSWRDDATGVWVRGGHKLDQHDHQDRGHVNFILRGRPILIEAGTPSYSNPDMGVHYSSGAGHNVLQVGTFFPLRPYPVQTTPRYQGWQRPKGVAPIEVRRLDRQGGSVAIDATGCYADVDLWRREVDWTRDQLTVRDRVRLKAGNPGVILFRWHLGTGQDVKILNEGPAAVVRWDAVLMRIIGNEPVEVRQYKSPDSTVGPREDHQHTCLEVRTGRQVNGASLTLTVAPSESSATRMSR
jgi:hypothetical protein